MAQIQQDAQANCKALRQGSKLDNKNSQAFVVLSLFSG